MPLVVTELKTVWMPYFPGGKYLKVRPARKVKRYVKRIGGRTREWWADRVGPHSQAR